MTDEEILDLTDVDRWNPAQFGDPPPFLQDGLQLTIFFDCSEEPPEPDDFEDLEEFKKAWKSWTEKFPHIVARS
ncbi:hypothetical protein [Trichormus variabilis]|uniref:Uncharacterized protein n=1 Tax=Trichormus variabilis SAG 1403-4b TaxID=447716 RepID=A0A433UFF8_ANAVA|nr:hypothetical protein [Trichormus variabilis]MBD2629883.1 hypothetical protein [Trichormus variabilis FACHB-164]RUS92541.1 hypothetical protein DSM107003_50240 [Trichormus variabilis SAG 1403-4b]